MENSNKIISELLDYFITFGYSLEQASSQVEYLINNDEIEDFYENMKNDH